MTRAKSAIVIKKFLFMLKYILPGNRRQRNSTIGTNFSMN
jgi:hypothetical protein